MKTNRNYDELSKIDTFEKRYDYLNLKGRIGEKTFGSDRWLNQMLYKHPKFLAARDKVIIRDNGCDLGIPGYKIKGAIYIHHMNPVTKYDILNNFEKLIDPEYLICSSYLTHTAIHYGNNKLLPEDPIIRSPNDTCPWKKNRKEHA